MSPAAPRCRARPPVTRMRRSHARARYLHAGRTPAPRAPAIIRTSGSWESGRPRVGGAPLASIRFATPTLRNTWQAPHRKLPSPPDGRGGHGGGGPPVLLLERVPEVRARVSHPTAKFPPGRAGKPTRPGGNFAVVCVGWVRNRDSSFLATPKGRDRVLHPPEGERAGDCVGGVRNRDSSFLATPKGRDRVLHLPQQSGEGGSTTRRLPAKFPRRFPPQCKVPPEVPPVGCLQKDESGVAHPTHTTEPQVPGLENFGQGVVVGAPLSSRRVASPKIRVTEPFPQGNFECGSAGRRAPSRTSRESTSWELHLE